MKSLWSCWRLAVVGLLAVLLVACKPFATFEVSPDAVVAGQVATFDASGTVVAPTPRNNAVVSYSWMFGDGGAATGQTVTHTFATAGTYTVTLSVTDKAGRVGTSSTQVVVEPAGVDPEESGTLKVSVMTADDTLLPGAQVSLGDVVATSDENGLATLNEVPFGAAQSLRVSKTGFITQVHSTAPTAGDTAPELTVRLQSVKQSLRLIEAEAPQMLLASSLGATVQLPGNALIDPQGQVASGAITVALTPWNVTGADLMAMPGEGRISDTNGSMTRLAVAAMITVEFTDLSSRHLQLTSEKNAVIRVDLPYPSFNGQNFQEGSTLPLWHFDETRGLWVQEGTGTVVASIDSPSGWAIQSTVSHFSTWAWGLAHWGGTNTVNLRCQNTDGNPIACHVTARLTEGEYYTFSTSIGATGVQIPDLPVGRFVTWTATTASGLRGATASGTSGTVVITLGPTATSNFVSCVLPGDVPVDCLVNLSGTYPNGNTETVRRFVPSGGATVRTSFDNAQTILWSGESSQVNSDASVTKNTGSTTSNPGARVNLVLSVQEVAQGKPVRVRCDNVLVDGGPVSTCFLRVTEYGISGDVISSRTTPWMNTGTEVTVWIPDSRGYTSVMAYGPTPPSPIGPGITYESIDLSYDSATANGLMTIQMSRTYFPTNPDL